MMLKLSVIAVLAFARGTVLGNVLPQSSLDIAPPGALAGSPDFSQDLSAIGRELGGCDRIEACGYCHKTLADAIAALPCSGAEGGISKVTIHTIKKLVVKSPIVVHGDVEIAAARSLPKRPRVVGDLNGEPIFKLLPIAGQKIQHFKLRGFEISGAKGTYTSGVRSEGGHAVQFEARDMHFTHLRTRDGVSGAAVYVKNAHNMLIDDNCVVSFNTIGEKDKGCETKHGPNSQYCKERCTPVYGGGTIYAHESSGTASIGGQYANNTVLFNHGQGGAVYIHNVTDGSLTVTGQFLNNVANEAGGVEIWQVNEEATVDINGVFYGNLARDLYGHCGSRGGAIAIRWIHGQVTVDGVFLNNRACAESHGGVLRTDKVFPGAKLEMKGVYKGNYAKFGNEVNVFFLYEGSRFSFNPTIAPEDATGRNFDDIIYISRSSDCTNTATYPNINIDGCTPYNAKVSP